MATKRKSIIEEALLEAKSLEDALKANTKEMLATHMKQEIESIVESSLKVRDEESKNDIVEGSDEKTEVPVLKEQKDEESEELVLVDAGDDSEEEADADADVELDGLELDLDLDALAAGAEEDEVEDLALAIGDEEELDLTGASDDEVIAVFKKMGDDDEVEVIKDEDGIHLTDNEAGTEYYIKESEELDEEELCEGCDGDVVYEIELDEHGFDHVTLGGDKYDLSKTHTGRDYTPGHHRSKIDHDAGWDKLVWGGNAHDKDHGHPGDEDYTSKIGTRDKGHPGDRAYTTKRGDHDYHRDHHDIKGHPFAEDVVVDLDGDEVDESTRRTLADRRRRDLKPSNYPANESRKSRKPLSEKRRTSKNVRKVADSKIVKEYKELKSKNNEYKEALKVFKNKLNEVALFNTNLAYVNRLFTEHSTTKTEKMEILKRFDGAESIKESKNIYKTVKGELDTKTPITESVENKVNKTVKSSKSDLNESTAYVDPQIMAIKDLMKRIS